MIVGSAIEAFSFHRDINRDFSSAHPMSTPNAWSVGDVRQTFATISLRLCKVVATKDPRYRLR